MMMLTKQSKVHNETIWKSPYLRKFLDLANWLVYMETGESCCLKWSYSLTLCEIPWRFSSILSNVKISLTLCKIPWQFPDLEKFYFSLTFPWRLWTLVMACCLTASSHYLVQCWLIINGILWPSSKNNFTGSPQGIIYIHKMNLKNTWYTCKITSTPPACSGAKCSDNIYQCSQLAH